MKNFPLFHIFLFFNELMQEEKDLHITQPAFVAC